MMKNYCKISLSLILTLIFSLSSAALYTDGTSIPPKITTYNPDRRPRAVSSLDFSASFTVKVDGVPVRIEMPGKDDYPSVIRVTTYVDNDEKRTIFEYNASTDAVRMAGKDYDKIYLPDQDPTNCYIVTERMMNIARAAFQEIGLSFDPFSRDLVIDKYKYTDKINPEVDLAVVNEPDSITLIMAYQGETAQMIFDKETGLVTLPSDISFAKAYDWDVADGLAMAVTDDPYAGVVAAGEPVIETPTSRIFKSWYVRFLSYPVQNLVTLVMFVDRVTFLRQEIATVLKPIERLPDPEIIDIFWVSKQDGIIKIVGKGGSLAKPPQLYIKNSLGEAELVSDAINWTGSDTWNFTNYNSKKIIFGENKINIIIRDTGNREAESGDVTVYKAIDQEPSVILLEPRDRQVYADVNFPVKDPDFRISGKTDPSVDITIFGKHLYADKMGQFNQTMELDGVNEGNNEILIALYSPMSAGIVQISKNLIGAYAFVCDSQNRTYILRRGDFIFNGKTESIQAFDFIPYEPNHTGIYAGNGLVIEAVKDNPLLFGEVLVRNLKDYWDNPGFYYATQVPKLVDESIREQVVILAAAQKGKPYEYPIHFSNLDRTGVYYLDSGQYTPDNGRFYCSELAYWAWNEICEKNSIDFGIVRQDLMYPDLGKDDPKNCSILPAFFCKKTMEVR